MCPSTGETAVFMRHLVLVILVQVDILKIQGRYLQASDKISVLMIFYHLPVSDMIKSQFIQISSLACK